MGTADAAEVATAEWVDCYNTRRLNEYDGDMPPAVLENRSLRSTTTPGRRLRGVELSSLRTLRGGSFAIRRRSGLTSREHRTTTFDDLLDELQPELAELSAKNIVRSSQGEGR